ncbi:putative adipose-regulatory protein-domain-containing protein [Usnea florida]
MDDSSEPKRRPGLIARAIETALLPFHAAVSKPAQRAYLGTFLFTAASVLLLCVSSVAYTLFYYNYVPQNSVERVVHLQFGHGAPHGTAPLSTSLTSLQPYDITLTLHLPRTPSNLAVGNFMLDLSLHGPSPSPPTTTTTTAQNNPPLARSRRPAILTYASPLTATAHTLTTLPLHILGLRSESETLSVPMFESISFPKGAVNVPQSLHVTIDAADQDAKMQFYDVRVRFIARLRGLRWVLYHHRILSFVFFTTAFWSSAVVSMGVAWLVLSTYLGSVSAVKNEDPPTNGSTVKRERADSDSFDPTSLDDLSDTSRTFPTLGRQMPLYFPGRKNVMREEEIKREEDEVIRSTQVQPLAAAEADDEDEYMSQQASGFRDSGIGTGLDDERLSSVQRRRKTSMNGRDSGA